MVSVPDYGELILNFANTTVQAQDLTKVSVPDYGELILNPHSKGITMKKIIVVSVPDYGELILNGGHFMMKSFDVTVSVPDYGELILNIGYRPGMEGKGSNEFPSPITGN